MTKTIIPIPPSFDIHGEFNPHGVEAYIQYLKENGANALMTTVGTSLFNLLSIDEIHEMNAIVCSSGTTKIVGIPPLSTFDSIKFAKDSMRHLGNASLMAIYPDRYYDNASIIDHLSKIRDVVCGPLYLHATCMRSGKGGTWDYTHDIISHLFDNDIICGIKEEHSNLQASYEFVRNLPKGIDVIVAGGSMRRHQFLRSAGANSFLSGIGSLYPDIELKYCKGVNVDEQLEKEALLFGVFNKHGWHRSLRIGISTLIDDFYDRLPWPKRSPHVVKEIKDILVKIRSVNEQ